MIDGLRVESAGTSTTVQDQGRVGYQRYGIPIGGALDRVSLMAANTVVGNDVGTAALECLYQGPVLRVTARSVRVAIAGAGAQLEITDRHGDRHIVAALESVRVMRDEIIRVRLKGPGMSAYLAVEGGLAVTQVLGSYSTFSRARIGGYAGRPVQDGDSLPVRQSHASERDEVRLANVSLKPGRSVRIMPGPQVDAFMPGSIEALCEQPYVVSPACDRMGMRLAGPKLSHRHAPDIPSEGMVSGSIQVPGDGQPIVLLADCQTIGGYAKIGIVISADLPLLGRLGPGHQISFSLCTIEEAKAARKELAAEIAGWRAKLEPLGNAHSFSRLYSTNLISGVADAMYADW